MKKKNLILTAAAAILMIFIIIAVIIVFNTKNPKQGTNGRVRLDRLETAPEESSAASVLEKEPDPIAQLKLHGSFKPLVSGKLGTHIYYTDNVFKDRNLKKNEEKEMKDYLEQADKKMSEDIVIVGWSGRPADNTLMFNAYQYVDGVVVPEVFYRLTQDGGVSVVMISDIPAISSLDTAGLADPEELFQLVDDLAWQHKSQLYMDRDDKIYVIYHPEYDAIKDELYYYFMINEYSRIRIDAKTKDVLEEYYFNGEYID